MFPGKTKQTIQYCIDNNIPFIEIRDPGRVLENAEQHLRNQMNWNGKTDLENPTFQAILFLLDHREHNFFRAPLLGYNKW